MGVVAVIATGLRLRNLLFNLTRSMYSLGINRYPAVHPYSGRKHPEVPRLGSPFLIQYFTSVFLKCGLGWGHSQGNTKQKHVGKCYDSNSALRRDKGKKLLDCNRGCLDDFCCIERPLDQLRDWQSSEPIRCLPQKNLMVQSCKQKVLGAHAALVRNGSLHIRDNLDTLTIAVQNVDSDYRCHTRDQRCNGRYEEKGTSS